MIRNKLEIESAREIAIEMAIAIAVEIPKK